MASRRRLVVQWKHVTLPNGSAEAGEEEGTEQ